MNHIFIFLFFSVRLYESYIFQDHVNQYPMYNSRLYKQDHTRMPIKDVLKLLSTFFYSISRI